MLLILPFLLKTKSHLRFFRDISKDIDFIYYMYFTRHLFAKWMWLKSGLVKLQYGKFKTYKSAKTNWNVHDNCYVHLHVCHSLKLVLNPCKPANIRAEHLWITTHNWNHSVLQVFTMLHSTMQLLCVKYLGTFIGHL